MAVDHTILVKNGHKTVKLTPRKAIRQKCMECSMWNTAEVRRCPVEDCALWPYRVYSETQGSSKIYSTSHTSSQGGFEREKDDRGRDGCICGEINSRNCPVHQNA